MLLTEDYVLSNEVSEKGNIHIANFSNFAKHIQENDIQGVVIKQGNCTFLNMYSPYLPKNFREIINSNKFTSLNNSILSTYFCTQFQCLKGEILKAKKTEKNMDIIINEFKVSKKSFLRFDDNISSIFNKSIITNIPKKDFEECIQENYIEDGVRLSRNNYLVWYKI